MAESTSTLTQAKLDRIADDMRRCGAVVPLRDQIGAPVYQLPFYGTPREFAELKQRLEELGCV